MRPVLLSIVAAAYAMFELSSGFGRATVVDKTYLLGYLAPGEDESPQSEKDNRALRRRRTAACTLAEAAEVPCHEILADCAQLWTVCRAKENCDG